MNNKVTSASAPRSSLGPGRSFPSLQSPLQRRDRDRRGDPAPPLPRPCLAPAQPTRHPLCAAPLPVTLLAGGTSGRRSLTVRAGAGSPAPERAARWPPVYRGWEVRFRRAGGLAGRRSPRLCTVPNSALLPATPGARRRSPSPAPWPVRCSLDSCRAGARQRVWRGSAREPRGRGRAPPSATVTGSAWEWSGQLGWVGWWRLCRGVCCPRESLPLLHRPPPLL